MADAQSRLVQDEQRQGAEPPERRLAMYLQEQYHKRVIEPVAEQINPEGIRDRASELYLQLFGQQLPTIIQRYNAPPDQSASGLTASRSSPWDHRLPAMPPSINCSGPNPWLSNLPGRRCASTCTNKRPKRLGKPRLGCLRWPTGPARNSAPPWRHEVSPVPSPRPWARQPGP